MSKIEAKPKEEYFPALDGLRGLSILLVLLNHMIIPLPTFLEFFRDRGHLGVEIFFAVSGFLVTRSLHVCWDRSGKNLTRTLYEFYIRRFARILIPYLIILASVFALSAMIPSLGSKLSSISDIFYSFFVYTYNYAKFSTSGDVPGALNIMWSLSFEEQFYLLLGSTFLVFRKSFFKALFILSIASLGLRCFSVLNGGDIGFNQLQFQTHLRLDAIIWGCLLYLGFDKCKKVFLSNYLVRYIFLLGVVVAFLLGSSSFSSPIVALAFALTAFFFTTLILHVQSLPESLMTKIFSFSILTFIGRISYEIYLTHQIVNGLVIKSGFNNGFLYVISFFGLTIFASWFFYKFINNPMQKYIRVKFL